MVYDDDVLCEDAERLSDDNMLSSFRCSDHSQRKYNGGETPTNLANKNPLLKSCESQKEQRHSDDEIEIRRGLESEI